MGDIKIQELDGAVVFQVKVIPGSSRTAIGGLLDGTLKVRVSAVAEKGKANRSVEDFLAERLGVRAGAVSIISGRTSAVKKVQVTGISAEKLLERLKLQ